MSGHLVDIAVFLAGFLLGLPLLTLLHELGHALTAALLIGGRATVVQGPGPARFKLSVWRLDLRLRGLVPPHRVWVGWALWGPHSARWRHAVATAAGPVVSGACSAACAYGCASSLGLVHMLLGELALASGFQTLTSGFPVRYGGPFGCFAGEASDGLRIARLLEGRPERRPLVNL